MELETTTEQLARRKLDTWSQAQSAEPSVHRLLDESLDL